MLGLGIVVGPRLASGVGPPVEGDASNIRHLSFQQTPNLYFISFDSIVPRPLLKKYMDLETTEFHDLFDTHFRRFPNFFAHSPTTSLSLNMLLALDVDVYTSMREELAERGSSSGPFLFAGQDPSRLLDIMHKNGYETTSIYLNTKFGGHKGPYIDHYITFAEKSVCQLLLDPKIRNLAFWGYCRCINQGYNWNHRLTAEQITKVSANDGPQFVMAHIYPPGHVTKSFRYGNAERLEEFSSRYQAQSKKAASYLELILRHLEENDLDAILLVYGDHGPLISQGLDFEDNQEFVFQDNYGILGGVYPPDTCAAEFDEVSAKGYMTVLDAVHALLRYLSGGESVLVEPREYTQPAYGPTS